jgi:hypothetical protein
LGHALDGALDVSVAGICAGNFPEAGDVCVAGVVTTVVVVGAGIVGVVGFVFAVVAVVVDAAVVDAAVVDAAVVDAAVVVTGVGIVGKTTGAVVVTSGALSTG